MFPHRTADTTSAPFPFPDLDVPWWIEPYGPEPENWREPDEAVNDPGAAQPDLTEA